MKRIVAISGGALHDDVIAERCRFPNPYLAAERERVSAWDCPRIASDWLEIARTSDHTDRPNQMTRPTTWMVERSTSDQVG